MDTEYFELEERFQKADRLINDGLISEAAKVLQEILVDAPDFGKAHNHMGWLYETKFKDFGKAEEHYRLSLKFTPTYPAIYYNYAYLLSSLRKFDELENLLDAAVKVPGINYATIYNEYGIMRELQGRYADAIDFYKLYIKNNFDSKGIDTATESIERCKRKMQIL
ncbi:MAG TPA: tetratricopeptide repeat protein [Cytophagales bacterium]|nr:tetratricopeptide repeat protein [Cytophagales bacterium]